MVDIISISDLRHDIGGRDLLPVGGHKAPRHNQPEHGHRVAFQESHLLEQRIECSEMYRVLYN